MEIGAAATCPARAVRVPADDKDHDWDGQYPHGNQVTGIPRKRHTPERSCIACGQKGPKGTLVRIVRTPDGPVKPDPTGRANGRGAYLCNRVACWERGLAKRALGHSLRVQITDTDLDALQNYYIEIIESGGFDNGMGDATHASADSRVQAVAPRKFGRIDRHEEV